MEYQLGMLSRQTIWPSLTVANIQLSMCHLVSRFRVQCSSHKYTSIGIYCFPDVQEDTSKMWTCSYLGDPEVSLETFNQIQISCVQNKKNYQVVLRKKNLYQF